jgi:hypothetical protein
MGNLYYVGEAVYKTISINGHEYQVPEAVSNYLQKLDNTLEVERQEHADKVAKLEKRFTKDIDTIAHRIMYNLNYGLAPMGKSWSYAKFEKDNRCLAFSLDETFGKVDSLGNPKFDFRDEVERRILAGLMGQTMKGEDYR